MCTGEQKRMACGHVLPHYAARCPASCPRCAARAAQRRAYQEKEREKKKNKNKEKEIAKREKGGEEKKAGEEEEEEEEEEKEREKKQDARRAELMAYFLRSENSPTDPETGGDASHGRGGAGAEGDTRTTQSRWVDGECVWEEMRGPDGARYTTERVVTAFGGAIKVRRGPFYDGAPTPAREILAAERQKRRRGGNGGAVDSYSSSSSSSGYEAGEEPPEVVSWEREGEEVEEEEEEEEGGKEEEIVEESPRVGKGQIRHRLRGARKCAAWLGGGGDGWYPEDAVDDENSSSGGGGGGAGRSEADSEIGDTERDDGSTSSQETVRAYAPPRRQPERRSAVAAVGDGDDEDKDEDDYEDIWLKIATREEKGKRVLRRVDNHI